MPDPGGRQNTHTIGSTGGPDFPLLAASNSRMMSKILREPLLHFLLIGAALFVVFGLVNDTMPGGADDRVIVTSGRIEQLANIFAKTWQRPPISA